MDDMSRFFLGLVFEIIIFLLLVAIGTVVYKKLMSSSNTLSNLGEILPEDEIHTLKQVFYLILMSLAFIDILYALISSEGLIYFVIFDIALSLFLAITLDKSSLKGKIILLLLVPFDSINFILFGSFLLSFIDIIHVLVFLYFIKFYYDKFRQYTESNGLSVTIVILFAIIFISFIVTQIVEGVYPLDSLVMVSNAFTSNGYAVLGTSMAGKMNALVLVWGGYILSGVGTATLTAAIMMKHFNHKFDEAEKSNKELKESIKNLEELIKNNETSGQKDD
ncbi:MAG: hypothetical protein Q4Q14_04045 [Methanobrevibacter sp.]|nr:hypothetical protein [Methanobrevibacter sp.]